MTVSPGPSVKTQVCIHRRDGEVCEINARQMGDAWRSVDSRVYSSVRLLVWRPVRGQQRAEDPLILSEYPLIPFEVFRI